LSTVDSGEIRTPYLSKPLINVWNSFQRFDICPVGSTDYYSVKESGGEPDLVLQLGSPYEIRSDGEDDFKLFVFPFQSDTNVYLKSVEFVPGNRSRVHHAWMFEDTTGYFKTLDSLSPGYPFDFFNGNGFFPLPDELLRQNPNLAELRKRISITDGGSAYTPGYTPKIYPAASGKLLRKNTALLVQIHYSGSGQIGDMDQSKLKLFFCKQPVRREVKQILIEQQHLISNPFLLRAGEIKKGTSRYEVTEDISLINLSPHMHYRGTEFAAYSISPRGKRTNLIGIPKWDFNWQGLYHFKKLQKIEAGSSIFVEGVFDNTAENPLNSVLPPVDVYWDFDSKSEMLGVFFEYLEYEYGDEEIRVDGDVLNPAHEIN